MTSTRAFAGRKRSRPFLFGDALILSLVVLTAGLSFSGAANALPFTNLIVFGDSIVDQGNTQALVTTYYGLPDPAPASAGYYGGRFTNGINPADVLNQEIEGTNSVGSFFGGDNYAYGGARARNNGDLLPDVAAQVADYLSRPPGPPVIPSTLFMINIGGNDVRDIVLGNLVGAARQAIINGAVAAVQSSVQSLQLAGAQNILFVGVGNVGGIPEMYSRGAASVAAGRQASVDMNAAIQAALPSNVTFFDTVALTDQVLSNPALFGLPAGLNTTTACLAAGAAPPSGAPTCNGYAFFDTVHPTTQVQQILGAQLIAVVPEPGTAILLMGGLALLASQRRRGEV